MEGKCYKHPEREATGSCHYCGRDLCSDCLTSGKMGQYFSCSNEADCLAYQEGQEVPVIPETAVDDYIADKSAVERYVERLGEIQNELGEIGKLLEKLAGTTEVGETARGVSKSRLPEFCAYKLAEEARALLDLTGLRVEFLRKKYERAGDSAKLQELARWQDHIRNEVEPLVRQTLEQMGSYSTMDAQKILESISP